MGNRTIEKLKEFFDRTVENGPSYKGPLTEMDYYALICKGASNESLVTIKKSNVSMFNYEYDGTESILILFAIPMNTSEGGKHIAERVMDMLKLIEECFTTVDYSNSKEVKEDKFVYLTVVKKLKEKLT